MSLIYNKTEGRLRAFWRITLNFIVFMLGSVLVSTIASIAGILLAVASGSIPLEALASPGNLSTAVLNLAVSSPLVFLISSLGSLVITWLSTAAFAKWIDHRKMSDYGLALSAAWWKDLIFGLFLGAFLMTGIFIFESQVGWLEISSYLQSPPNLSFYSALLLMLLSFLAVGIYEELLVRGYQLRNIAEGLNQHKISSKTALMLSYIVTSAWFSILHLFNPNSSLESFVNLIVSGFFLGLGMVLTGRLALPIGLHITWNFFQGTIFGFPVSGLNTGTSLIAINQTGPVLWTGGQFGPEAGLIGLVAMTIGILLIIGYVRLTTGSVSPELSLCMYNPRKKAVVIPEQPSQF